MPFPTARACLALLAIAATVPQAADAQATQAFGDLHFQKLPAIEGTTAGSVLAIAQDTKGFIWIASLQGVYRYDGVRLRSFRNEENNPRSIAHDFSYTIHIDHKDQLWFGTHRGLSRYDHKTESFTNYLSGERWTESDPTNQVNAIASDTQGRVIASTEAGLIFRYNATQDKFIQLNTTPFGQIKSMISDPQDRIWIGFEEGVISFDPASNESRTYNNSPDQANFATANYINAIHYIDDQRLWIGASSTGAAELDIETGVISPIGDTAIGDRYITQITPGPDNGILVISNSSVTLYDLDGVKISCLTHDSQNGDIPVTSINTFFTDRVGNHWLGSSFDFINISTLRKPFKKLAELQRNPKAIPDAPVAALLKDSRGNLWIGDAKSGLDLYPADPTTTVIRFRNNPDDPTSISGQPVLKIFESAKGEIWIGTFRGGLQRHLPETNSFHSYLKNNDNPQNSIGGQDIRDIAEDEKGNLWINTHGNGIDYFNRETGLFTHYTSPFPGAPNSLIDNWAYTIFYDDDQKLWIGTPVGISVLNTQDDSFTNYQADPENPNSLSNPSVKDIYQCSKGDIWIATDNGLNHYNPTTNDFTTYSVQHGLPHPSVNAIVEDNQGHLWLGTAEGLAKFNPETLTAKIYDESDGLSGDEFFYGSVFKDPDGILYFGQVQGLTTFDPSEILDNKTPPEVFITGVSVFNKQLPITQTRNPVNTLDTSILETQSVSLSHRQNSITLEFAALNYNQSYKNQYSYKLEGFDSGWSTPSNHASAVYTNLNIGNYTFKVKASNNDGYWSEANTSLDLTILPPFWATTWFRILSIALAILIPALLVYWKINSIKRKKNQLEIAVSDRTKELSVSHQELEAAYKKILSYQENLETTVQERTKELEIAKVEAEKSELLKSAFLANMSHEIRTPMNAIVGFLQFLDDDDLPADERSKMRSIVNQNCKILLTLIDDILDLSTIEAGKAEIANEAVDIREICQELEIIIKSSIQSQLILNISDNTEYITIDPLKLKQILTNLITNAFKFTKDGEVKLGYKIQSDKITFYVKDTGIGIPADQLNNIFNRFHKIEPPTGQTLYRGTGLGLTISKKLTELMGGQIEVTSTEGLGSEFTITFPYQPAIPPRYNNESASQAAAPTLEQYTILVAEDETQNFEYIRQILKKTKIKILRAKNGQEALDLFNENKVNIALLDLKMPVMSGYEATRQIRASSPHTPIITQSAYAMAEDREKALNAGANTHLPKPFTPTELIEQITHLLPSKSSSS